MKTHSTAFDCLTGKVFRSKCSRASVYLLLSAILICMPARMYAQEYLDSAVLKKKADLHILTVSFNNPVNYIWHFPDKQGDTLTILLRPVAQGRTTAPGTYNRERVPVEGPPGIVSEVSYETSPHEGPYLVIYFPKITRYSIRTGTDFRSVVVSIRQ